MHDKPPVKGTGTRRRLTVTSNTPTENMDSSAEGFISDKLYLINFIGKLNEMRGSEVLCDVLLTTENGNTKFYAHRAVLAASSSYFYKLYTGTSLSRYNRETVLQGITDAILQVVLDYIYSARIVLTQVNIEQILCASFQLGLESLKLECEQFLIRYLCVENCIKMTAMARIYSCEKLLQEGKRFMTEHFMEIQNSEEFFRMPKSQLEEIVADDDLNVKNEEQIFNSIRAWVNFDVISRRDSFSDLLSRVRLPFIARTFLLGTIDKDPLVTSSSASKELVAEALSYKMASHKERKLLQNERTKRRWKSHLTDVIILVGGVIENGTQACCHCYNPLTSKWYYLPPVIDSRLNFGLARLHRCLFVVGGSTLGENMSVLESVERLDPKFNAWEKVTLLSSGRLNHEAVELHGKIYVVGGVLRSNNQEQTMECYDHVTDSWISLSPPRQKRYTHCAVSMDGYIYVIGGISKSNTVLRTVERYDPHNDKWANVASLNTPRSGACAVALTGRIYVIGGGSDFRNILRSCEIYDPSTDKWTYGKEMNTKRDRAGAAAFGGKIYVFGGSYGHVAVTSVECYDCQGDQWNIITELPYPRYGFRCAKTVVSRDIMAEVPPPKPLEPAQEKLI